jgi:hypothetical protein
MFKYTLNTGNVVGSKSTSFSSSCPAADSPAGVFSALIGSVEVDMGFGQLARLLQHAECQAGLPYFTISMFPF